MIKDCKLGKNVKIPYPKLVNLYGCSIGDNTFVGPFVEIQKGVKIGRCCKIESHSFICEGVELGDDVFVGHSAVFINDLSPRASKRKWHKEKTVVKDRVSIGSNATILPVILGEGSLIGAGAVVVKNVKRYSRVVGNPAREII